MRKEALLGLVLVSGAAVVGCGGGSGSGTASLTAPGKSAASMSQARFTLTIPTSASSSSAVRRKPAYVSPNVASISITAAAVGASPGPPTTESLVNNPSACTTGQTSVTCTIDVDAPIGTDTFVVTTYDTTGAVLSTASVNATVSANAANAIPIVLDGTVASITVTVTGGNNVVPGGYPTTLPVVVDAMDATGALIVGPGNYSNPITLTNADTSGVTSLSTTLVTSPSTAVTLSYQPSDANGGVINVSGLPTGETSIGAAASGVPSGSVTAGTFQYIADRFFGYNHVRTLNGTDTVSITTYNSSATPSPGPSTFNYTLTVTDEVHPGQVFNGVTTIDTHQVWTYTPSVGPAQTLLRDIYRAYTTNPTGAIYYRYGYVTSDTYSGSGNSPITGAAIGTTVDSQYYPSTGGWEEDALPHVTATWNNTGIPFTDFYTGAETATVQYNADGSWSFNETSPNVINESQTASGSASQSANGVTTMVSLPQPTSSPYSGDYIPVAQQTTSPSPGPTAYYAAADWYPGAAAPVQPLISRVFSGTTVPIPGGCGVPPTIATQAYAIVEQFNQLRIFDFQNRQETFTDYFVPGGIGFVCETYVRTQKDYRFHTGVISSNTVETYAIGVTSSASLSIRRH